MQPNKTIRQVLLLGFITGMRATFAAAIVSHYFSKKPNAALAKSKLGFIQKPATAIITKVLSAGEIAGDKLPSTPNRIVASQVIARVVSGAFAGAVISTANKENVVKGILTGGATAFTATFATFYLRKNISKSTFIKEPFTGALEDLLAISIGTIALKDYFNS